MDPTADVHDNSGIPNNAFALFARAVGGRASDQAIHVWYDTSTDRLAHVDGAQRVIDVDEDALPAPLEALVRPEWPGDH